MSELGQQLMERLLSSDAKAQLLVLFRRNPGLVDEVEGIARRVGRRSDAVVADLRDLVEVGVVQERRIGGTVVFSLNSKKDSEVQRAVGTYLLEMKTEGEE